LPSVRKGRGILGAKGKRRERGEDLTSRNVETVARDALGEVEEKKEKGKEEGKRTYELALIRERGKGRGQGG